MIDESRIKRMEKDAAKMVKKGVSHWNAGRKEQGDKHIAAANALNTRIDLARSAAKKSLD